MGFLSLFPRRQFFCSTDEDTMDHRGQMAANGLNQLQGVQPPNSMVLVYLTANI